MTEPTDRDRALFFGAMDKIKTPELCAKYALPVGLILEIGKHMIPAIAAAREEGRREALDVYNVPTQKEIDDFNDAERFRWLARFIVEVEPGVIDWGNNDDIDAARRAIDKALQTSAG